MRPQMVMLEVRPLDARKQQVGKPFKFPHIELDNIVFLRVPEKKMKQMQRSGQIEQFRDSLVEAAGATGLAYVTTAEVISMLDEKINEIRDGDKAEFAKSDVEHALATIRSEVGHSARPTNKTFILLEEPIRFLEVKEKWEVIPEDSPGQPS